MRAKRYAWRATALYFWLIVLAAVLGLYDGIQNVERDLIDGLLSSLTSVGFEPVNPDYIGGVLRVVWVLTITVFRPMELLSFTIYVLTFPVLIIGLYVLKKILEYNGTEWSSEQSPSTVGRPLRAVTGCSVLLAAWIVLYGGATEWPSILPGIALSGCVLFLVTFRLFARVRPVTSGSVGRFGWLVSFAERYPNTVGEEPDESKGRGGLGSEAAIMHFHRRWLVRTALMMRGSKGRNRIVMLVFAEYIVSLIIVAAAAIFFWALVISVTGSEPIPLFDSLRISTTYFLPGIETPNIGVRLPFWTSVGPAATGWVLFVLYIGPAGSVLPDRQRAAATELENTYHAMRHYAAVLGRGIKKRKKLRETLPE